KRSYGRCASPPWSCAATMAAGSSPRSTSRSRLSIFLMCVSSAVGERSSPICHRAVRPAPVGRLPEAPFLRLGAFLVDLDAEAGRGGHGEDGAVEPRLHGEDHVGIVDARRAVVEILRRRDPYF